MAHQRQIIRESAKAVLVAANTAAADRVFETRMVPWQRTKLPAIGVYTLTEAVTPESKTTAPRELERVMQLEVVAAVTAGDNVDDALDAIAQQIEVALHKDETFGGVCGNSILTTSELSVEMPGEQPIGFVSMIYEVTYFTYAPEATDTTLDDLNTVDVKTNVGGGLPDANQAEDLLPNLES